MTKLKLKKLILGTDEKQIEITVEEAKELFAQLNELFGEKVKYYPSNPPVVLPNPIIIERDVWPKPYWEPYVTWQDSNTATITTGDMKVSYCCEKEE